MCLRYEVEDADRDNLTISVKASAMGVSLLVKCPGAIFDTSEQSVLYL